MILVFVFLGIVILMCLSIFLFINSNIKLEVKKIHISNTENKLKTDFVLNIGVYLFNKIKTINFTIDNLKINNLLQTGKIDMKKLKENKAANKDILEVLKDNEFRIDYLKLDGYFATYNNVLSCLIYGAINAIVPIAIAKRIDGKYINEIKFLNINQNIVNINLNCIISIKTVNIINILHYLKKKGGKENNGKSSDRRSYAYSNE